MEKKETTRYHTPCSPAWDDEWIKEVNKTERERGHACCGAKTSSGNPCKLKPNHENGRCKFHGGFDCTGAQPGNRNAVIHGLYSRGIQTCGPHCPMWKHCPVADQEIEKLSNRNRPRCPYEVTQFQIAVSDARERIARKEDSDSFDNHIAHQAALLQVMVTRASSALTIHGLTEETKAKNDKGTVENTKMSAALTAFSRLSTEYRHYLRMLEKKTSVEPTCEQLSDAARRRNVDGELSPEAQEKLCPPPIPGMEVAEKYLEKAANHAKDATMLLRLYGPHVEQLYPKRLMQYESFTEKAMENYAKAFELVPELREMCLKDPKHDPAFFPEEEEEPEPVEVDQLESVEEILEEAS